MQQVSFADNSANVVQNLRQKQMGQKNAVTLTEDRAVISFRLKSPDITNDLGDVENRRLVTPAYLSVAYVTPTKREEHERCAALCAAFIRGGGKITRIPTKRRSRR